MKKITILLLTAFSISAHSQTFEWLQTPEITYNQNPDGLGYPITSDFEGNTYMTGFKENPFLYNDVMGTVFYNKYNTSGDIIYSKTIEGQSVVYDIATDFDGNLLMAAGYVNSFAMGDFGLITINQGVQFLLLKCNPDGDLLWYHEIAMEDTFVNDFRTVTTDSNNNIYIGYDDYMNARIVKLSPDGTVLQTIEQQGTNIINSISVDNEGNIYAAGSCADFNASFAGVSMPTDLLYNTYLAKYTANGEFQWVKYIEDVTCPSPQVKAFSPDAIYFSSYLFESFDFDTITTEGPTLGDSDFFLAKLDASGTFQWVREVPGIGGATTGKKNYLSLDAEGNVYFAGATEGTIDWGNNQLTEVNGIYDDALVLKYNPNGNVIMALTAGGTSYDRLDGIVVNADGEILISGMSHGNATFGSIEHNAPDVFYPYLAKITTAPLGIPEFETTPLAVFPNPTSNRISLGNNLAFDGSIYTTLGQKVIDFSLLPRQELNVSKLAAGVYYITSENSKTLRFIKK